MEKKLYDLTIDEELEGLIPPLQEMELKMLTESLLENGCEMPLVVWNNVIVDGHNRYRICKEEGIPFSIEEKDFESRDAAKIWLIKNQLGRRNLPDFVRCELVIPMEELLKEQAEKRMLLGKKAGSTPVPNLAQGQGKTRDALASMAGVSHGTMDKVKKIIESADDVTKDALRKGEISIHKAYTELKDAEKANSPADPASMGHEADDLPPAEEPVTPPQEPEAIHNPEPESMPETEPTPVQDHTPEPESAPEPTLTPQQNNPIIPKSFNDLFRRPVFDRNQPLCVITEPIPFEPVVSAATMAAFEAEKREKEHKANIEGSSVSPEYAATAVNAPEEIYSVEEDLRELIDDFLEDLSEVLIGMTSGNAALLLEMVQNAGERAVHTVKEHMEKMEEQK